MRTVLNRFVGRTTERAVVHELLREARMVTLTGLPGVGKTRLALEVAHEAGPRFADGAWLAELASVSDADLVAVAVAAVLSVGDHASADVMEAVAAHVGNRELLIVLDNCEHVVEACARLAETLLRTCPNLRILATSQEPLRFAGEQLFPVPPLSLPDKLVTDPLRALAASEAVQLFLDRAQAASPGFEPGGGDSAAVVEICRHLDGIPLAIELAAAQVGTLAPPEIRDRLGHRFDLLTSGKRTVPARHQTLLGAVDWSYDLLGDGEKALLRRLSVFSGGATLEAVEHVCSEGAITAEEMCDLLGRLVSRSLVAVVTDGAASRYRLTETIRAYAAAQLADAGETPRFRDRHCAWCVELVEWAEPGLTGADQHTTLQRLEVEQDNVRAALDWAVEGSRPDLGLRLAGAFTLFWRMRGSFREGLHRIERILGATAGGRTPAVAKARWGAGFLAVMLMNERTASEHLQESLGIYQGLADKAGIGRCLLLLANLSVFSAPGEALPVLDQSIVHAREAGDSWCQGHGLALAGLAQAMLGKPDEARRTAEEAVAVGRSHSDAQTLRFALIVQGSVAFGQGDCRSAALLFEEVLALGHRLREGYSVGAALNQLGRLATIVGDYGNAEAHLTEALEQARRVGAPTLLAGILSALGGLSLALGDFGAARRYYEEAVALARYLSGIAPELPVQGLAEVLAALGEADAAHRLFQEAVDHGRQIGNAEVVAAGLHGLGRLGASSGDRDRAASLVHEALRLYVGLNHRLGMVDCLETLAGLAAPGGDLVRAARLLGASATLRENIGYARHPAGRAEHESLVAAGRTGLGGAEWEAAWAEGSQLSAEEAAGYASRARGRRARASTGWDSLTSAERTVVTLVAQGMTNAEVGARLFISPRTVESHLSSVYTKVGVGSRAELAVEALRHGLVPPPEAPGA